MNCDIAEFRKGHHTHLSRTYKMPLLSRIFLNEIMKLHPLQRWAYKLGVPIKVLNIFAQEYYGYAIPNADGKYPDWWYEQQGVPTTFRDCEVPEEVLKKDGKRRNRGTMSPKVYVRVRHGKIVEVVANSALQSEPNLSQYRGDSRIGYPQTVFTRERYEMRAGEGGVDDIETDEIVTRVVEMRRNDHEPRMTRSTSVPVFPPSTRSSDIMSFIREERMPRTTRPNVVPRTVNPEPLLHDANTAGQGFSQPHRSATVPTPRSNIFTSGRSVQPLRMPSGPSLPSNPRPSRHERTQTSVTDDTVLGYYYSPATNGSTTPRGSYRQPQERNFTPMEGVEEDAFTEWSEYASGNDDDEEGWEDEEEFGTKAEHRRAAAQGLREYRQEY